MWWKNWIQSASHPPEVIDLAGEPAAEHPQPDEHHESVAVVQASDLMSHGKTIPSAPRASGTGQPST